MSFLLGTIGDRDSSIVSVGLEDRGVLLIAGGRFMSGVSGIASLDVNQTRELGELLIKAADQWDNLTEEKRQIEAARKDLDNREREAVKQLLGRES